MTKQTITAVIPAKNEEDNIERCVKSVLWCDKVMVLWMGSDKTGEIAKKLGAEVLEMNKSQQANFESVQKNINWSIDHCTTDWILRIDADEEVTTELKHEIERILTLKPSNFPTDIVAYGIPRKQYFFGGFLRGGDWAYDKLVRLFKPQFARYDPIVPVHEQFKVNGDIEYLKNTLNHYSHPDLTTALAKFNTYTSMEIENMNETYIQAVIKMFLLPKYIFLRWMIWHHGYRDGLRGVVAGIYRAMYEFIKYTKYIEKKYQKKQIS